MTLISLLLVLAIERATHKTRHWQADFYFQKYLGLLEKKHLLTHDSPLVNLLAMVILPPLVIWLLLYQWHAPFISLVINSLILMVCIGCPQRREQYRGYLDAANRGDTEAANIYAEQLGYPCQTGNSLGQCLAWINYRHYAAPVIWFIAFGGAGALLYVLARQFLHYLAQQRHPLTDKWQQVMTLIDWIPARVSTLGLLVVGHFSKATPIWLGYLGDTEVSSRQLVTEVARAAEYVEPGDIGCTDEPCTMVRLMKRNMMFILVAVAVLTLGGMLR
ncbi:beta-lactamase regulator AmpE [Bowmanella dokdonensis]|uniref:Beta-lactamase regulator AmpE n=1 Tax=Bowmanella dokdonensis TaxID=751969 RepID=A0A939DJY3_9ALTE|nr:beta-lactamase regulator AmpE [Bowmanella dokdonensis]MBN7824119.1 beta-lactamase regulator AmpE [Bowmanella dokdonensis]